MTMTMTLANNNDFHIRKATMEDTALLTLLGYQTYRDTFENDNTEENMRAYCDGAFGHQQQSIELADSRNTILFVEVDLSETLENHIRSVSGEERLQFLKDKLVSNRNEQGVPRLAIAYSKMTRGNDEPCLSYKQEDTVELCRFYVLKEWHSKGVAHRLMQECLQIAKVELCCKSIWLGVWEHNHRAQKFYNKYKFESVGDHVFQMGDDAQTDYVMELIF